MAEFVLYRNTKDRCSHEKEAEVMEAADEAKEAIDYEEFVAIVKDIGGIAANLGYGPDLPLKDDWSVGFYTSTYGGLPCAIFSHTECDFIFLKPEDAAMLQEAFENDMTPLEWKRHTQFGKDGIDPR